MDTEDTTFMIRYKINLDGQTIIPYLVKGV